VRDKDTYVVSCRELRGLPVVLLSPCTRTHVLHAHAHTHVTWPSYTHRATRGATWRTATQLRDACRPQW